jgi:hypothetical protein
MRPKANDIFNPKLKLKWPTAVGKKRVQYGSRPTRRSILARRFDAKCGESVGAVRLAKLANGKNSPKRLRTKAYRQLGVERPMKLGLTVNLAPNAFALIRSRAENA